MNFEFENAMIMKIIYYAIKIYGLTYGKYVLNTYQPYGVSRQLISWSSHWSFGCPLLLVVVQTRVAVPESMNRPDRVSPA